MAINTFFEHLGLIAGMVLAAVIANQAGRTAAALSAHP
jgi:hypothetical protein